jgi:hypothetical protein
MIFRKGRRSCHCNQAWLAASKINRGRRKIIKVKGIRIKFFETEFG